jgi:hypothetical protein
MNMQSQNGAWTTHPLAQIASLLLFVVFAVGAVLVGAVVFSLLLGVAAVGGLVLYARLWWLRRKGLRGGAHSSRDPARGEGQVIDVQYEVIRERREQERD